ncbi:hypothetical protein [Nocardioides bruguierae]|uniref:Uncharacterized protein n=1 Tax=Nocardioides bruguierae TaxID=2945102 RepID=A0A9X2D9S0_9ACTN|nr:hypothetical protein [Nocardioides bruguierae]MCM0621888.1 hypothetical protein [Nocardioides bruguierae]
MGHDDAPGGHETLRELHTVVPASLFWDLGRELGAGPAGEAAGEAVPEVVAEEGAAREQHLLDWVYGATDVPPSTWAPEDEAPSSDPYEPPTPRGLGWLSPDQLPGLAARFLDDGDPDDDAPGR